MEHCISQEEAAHDVTLSLCQNIMSCPAEWSGSPISQWAAPAAGQAKAEKKDGHKVLLYFCQNEQHILCEFLYNRRSQMSLF